MSVRMRHTRGHTGNRRSHHALDSVGYVVDKDTKNLRLPHHIDEITGLYRGRQIAKIPVLKTVSEKVSSVSTSQESLGKLDEHKHEYSNIEHLNTEKKVSKGILGKVFSGGGKPKARSGFGGGA